MSLLWHCHVAPHGPLLRKIKLSDLSRTACHPVQTGPDLLRLLADCCVQFMTGQAMLFTLGRSDGVSQGWFSMWLRMMGADGWFAGWLKAKEQYTGKTRRDLGLDESSIIGSMANAARRSSVDVGSVAEGLAALRLKIADKPYAPQLPGQPCAPQVVEVSVST